ncbi:GerAB/ArcD/ProY family transporter [Brevibacillus choshinensis]|uniref:GerAB/ArcD/ProY family transporter n=1 Tax=Brevibacillus choshinensis TaxID=54911 RepID=A0ABX7FKZ3_BRECH|nr:GerAB/ArcD/ProY family transporter [Brevibacillus choshinensis]QRG66903.1 GerAB/ArcD/ProY family transporter [Brevibacillus choshinensis]
MIKDRLTTSQITVQLLAAMVGVGVLNLPESVGSKAGVDSWIVLFAAGFLAMVAVSIMAYLGNRFPGQSIIHYAPLLIGRFFGTIVLVAFLVYFLVFVGTVVRISADVTKLFLLDLTPLEVIIIGMLSVSTYLVLHGINAIARFNEFIQPLTLFLLMLVLTQTIRDTDLGRILPVLGDGIQPLFRAFPTTFFAFMGFEILLFIQPFMEQPRSAQRASLIAVGTTMLLYVIVTILSIAVLGKTEVTLVEYPTLAIIKNIEVPGAFIERLDSIMMMVWIPFAVTTIVMFHYCASLIASQLFGLQEHRVIALLFIPVVFLIAVLPRNILEVDRWSQLASWLGVFLIGIVPIWLVLVYKWKKRRQRV